LPGASSAKRKRLAAVALDEPHGGHVADAGATPYGAAVERVAACAVSLAFLSDFHERCVAPLKSIELTLGRVEWCTVGDHSNSIAREATDIQCTQVSDGDVVRGLELPIHLVLPRLYTCPTVDADTWGVEFELSVVATLDTGSDGAHVTFSTRMPLRLVRGTREP
jgi:hypothetical protein